MDAFVAFTITLVDDGLARTAGWRAQRNFGELRTGHRLVAGAAERRGIGDGDEAQKNGPDGEAMAR